MPLKKFISKWVEVINQRLPGRTTSEDDTAGYTNEVEMVKWCGAFLAICLQLHQHVPMRKL